MGKAIAQTLRTRIARGQYNASGRLPPELKLMVEFDVSRFTIRDAIQQLVLEGTLERFPGRGTLITTRAKRSGRWALKSIADLRGEFALNTVRVLYQGLVPAKRYPSVASLFGVPRNGSLFLVKRTFGSGDEPHALNNVFIRAEYADFLPKDEPITKPLIKVLESKFRLHAFRAEQVSTADAADDDIAKILDIPKGSPVLVLRRTYTTRDNDLIEFTELIGRPDRYSQTVQFTRDTRRASKD